MMERGNTDAVKMQKNFIEFVTKPLFEALSKCFDSSVKLKVFFLTLCCGCPSSSMSLWRDLFFMDVAMDYNAGCREKHG